MKNITIEWTYPMDIDNIIYDERMCDIGLYYITCKRKSKYGFNERDLYIGKTTYNYGSRLDSHWKNWIDDYRGKKFVRLGYLVKPYYTGEDKIKQLINDAEKTIIWLMRDSLIHNKQCMKDCHPINRLIIKNIGFRGNLSAEMGFTDEEWYG